MASSIIGSNRTAAHANPELLAEMIAATEEFPPSSAGDTDAIGQVRIAYSEEAEPIGTLPPPPSLQHLAKFGVKAVAGRQPNLFVDKLGERLAFERSGTRLYQALISKYAAYGSFDGGPSLEDLEHILQEELQHFELVRDAIEKIGADPTAVTPSANVHATLSKGIVAIMADPRADFVQSLEAALLAELADNDCWESLIALARIAHEGALAEQFTEALSREREHLQNVRKWLASAQTRSMVPAKRPLPAASNDGRKPAKPKRVHKAKSSRARGNGAGRS